MSALETVRWEVFVKDGCGGWDCYTGEDEPVEYLARPDDYEVRALTPLAPAQAEIERLKKALADAQNADAEATAHLRARALAAEEQVRVLSEALAKAEETARLYAGYYPQGSDGRNTFLILADHIAALQQKEKPDGR